MPASVGCEADGGQEAEANSLPPPRDFGAAIERSRDLLRRIKVLRERGWRGAGVSAGVLCSGSQPSPA